MPYQETGPRESTWGDSPSMTFCLVVWDEGDWPALGNCNDIFNNGDLNEGGRDDLRAKAYVDTILPPVRYVDNGICEDVLYLQSYTLKEIICGQKYKVTPTYGPREQNNLAGCKLSFQVGGGTINITQAKEHVASYFCQPAPPKACTKRTRFCTVPLTSNGQGGFLPGCRNMETGTTVNGPCTDNNGNPVPIGDCTYRDSCVPAGGGAATQGACRDINGNPVPPGQCIDANDEIIINTPGCDDMFGGAINVTETGVAGTDVLSQGLGFAISYCYHPSEVDCNYVFNLYDMAPSFNGDIFFGCFDVGEVLFKGASGQSDGQSFCITFDFCASPNIVNGTFGCLTGIDKLGWDYLWFYYEDRPDFGCHKMVKYPHSAHVERVYCPKDFSRLRLPC